MQLLVGSLVEILVGKSYHTKQRDGYILTSNDPTDNQINWICMSKKIGLYLLTTYSDAFYKASTDQKDKA